jgi:hypothetical protein
MTAPDGSETIPRIAAMGEAEAIAMKAKIKLQVHLNLLENRSEDRNTVFPSEVSSRIGLLTRASSAAGYLPGILSSGV